ncbi:hypothetical protein Leryth_001780 [Lithospermum erythrorhizon]|nr:hypothetical protein Leryth_001780 [Lithospermum erythrorhizon]
MRMWRSLNQKDSKVEVFMRQFGSVGPKQYSYSEIKKMTKSFAHKLGQGGYGSVYKGSFFDGRLVAVKVLMRPKEMMSSYMEKDRTVC